MSTSKKVIGVDFGGENLAAAAVVEVGGKPKVLDPIPRRKTPKGSTGRKVAAAIVRMVKEVKARHPDARAVGIGSPGIIDVATGDYYFEPCNIPRWSADGPVNLKTQVEAKAGITCFVNNDAQVFAAGEQRWGSKQAKKSQCMLFLTLGTGIGGALRVHGRDFWGARNTIEIGHTCVDFTDAARPCGCGNHGCAEAYASNTAIAGEALRYIRAGLLVPPKGAASWKAIGKQVDAAWVYRLAKERDPVARRIVDRAHQALAMLIANFANTVSVDLCVIGGGIAQAGAFLFDDVRRRVGERLLPNAEIAIQEAALKEDFALLGAGAFALDMLKAQEEG